MRELSNTEVNEVSGGNAVWLAAAILTGYLAYEAYWYGVNEGIKDGYRDGLMEGANDCNE